MPAIVLTADSWHIILFNCQKKPLYFVTTICTVDLLIPNFSAVSRTVVLFSIMYNARLCALSSILSFKNITLQCFGAAVTFI